MVGPHLPGRLSSGGPVRLPGKAEDALSCVEDTDPAVTACDAGKPRHKERRADRSDTDGGECSRPRGAAGTRKRCEGGAQRTLGPQLEG